MPVRKRVSTDPRCIALAVAAAFAPWFVPAAHAQLAANTLPTGGQVSAGAASISTDGSKMQIDQSTGRAILNWQSFSVGSSAWVNFTQPGASSVALNRVVGNDPSHIFGRLTANGQVFLVNNAGVFFAPGASVNVNALFASTLSISDQDFLAGRYQFFNPGSAGSVVNQGNIVTASGYTALVGPQVRNDGVIVARTGSIALVAANRVSLDLVGDGLISINVDQAALNASVINTGTLQADGGTVLLAARSANALLDTVINNSGIIRANSLVERNGEIVLDGGGAGVVANSGALQSAGLDAGTTGGTIKVLGHDVRLMPGARLDASGSDGGGTVLVGGNFQGKGPESNASNTYVDTDARILADAVNRGDGGKIIVWADQSTYFFGRISARGGVESGDGGFVEVSGKEFLAFRGSADRRAPSGKAGTLLLDPTDMTITAAAVGDVVCAAGSCTSNNDTSTLSTTDLQAALSAGDVNVDATAGGGAGAGTINWTDGSVDANANSLTLTGTSITFDGTLTNLNNLSFSSAPTGTGSATSSTGGAVAGIGSLTFALSGLNTGSAGGITLSGFGSADSTTVTGAAGFDDAARSSLGMTFSSATSVSGSGTISNVSGNFDDASLVSAASGIDYAGFNAVSGTGTALTGVDISFDDTTRVSGSGVDYSGFTNLATVSGNATALTGIATSFDDTTQVSGSGTNYGGLTLLATVAGDGTATITGVSGSFNDSTLVSSASTLDYAGFNAVSGTGTAVTNVAGNFSLDTHVSGASGVNYSGFSLSTVAGTGGGTIIGTARTYNVTGADAGNDGAVSWTNFASLSDAGGGTFNLTTGSLSGAIAGGTGSTLSYAGNAGPVSVNLQTGAATSVSAGITGINNLLGSGSAGDTLTGTNASATWTINGANGGTLSTGFTFANFENLTGGSASDSFVLSGGTVSGAINGGGGSDTLSGSTTYSISGPNAGTATGVASFTGIETLTGTGGNDTFTLAVASFNGTIDGAAGNDTLTAANVANNWVLTSVGAGTLNTTTIFTSIETMVGGTAMDTLSGSAPGGTTTMIDPTSLALGPLNASGGVVNLTAGSLGGTGVIVADSGTFVSNANVLGLGVNIASNLHMDGSATLWNFSAGSNAGSFSVANANISVQVAGVTRVASVGQQQVAAAIGTVAEQIGATIVEEANKTFGTDSVAEDVEYGFAGEIGATPPMDHRIDESGISLPRCVEEAREGMPCK